MEKWDVMTFADLCADFILRGGDVVPEFGQKEKMIGSYSVQMGGSGGIFGCQCAKLGLRAAVVGRVGRDVLGRMIRGELDACGADTRFVLADEDAATGLTCILQGGDDRAMLTVLGAMGTTGFGDAPAVLRENVRHVQVGSYYLLSQLKQGYPAFLRELRARGATVSLDTNWDPAGQWDGIAELAPLVDVFLPNENEVRAITGEQDVERGLRRLAERFPVVAVKLGERGAVAMAGGSIYRAEALRVPFVDAVGAGDSFDGGFLYGWLGGKPVGDCLRAACYCGSMNVTAKGGTAGQPKRSQLPEDLR